MLNVELLRRIFCATIQSSTFNLQPSMFNLQPSTFNVQRSTYIMQLVTPSVVAIAVAIDTMS